MKAVYRLSLIAAAALTIGATAASAEVVCNSSGDCWRVKERRTYEPSLNLKVYPDSWKWGDADKGKYRWRDSGRGHGYYRDGVWIEIK